MLVLFDLDNTLVDRVAAFRLWAAGFLEARGIDDAERAWLELTDGDGFVPRLDFLETVRARFGLPETAAELVAEYAESYPRSYAPVAEATVAVLADLRRSGRRIGIVTNGGASQQVKIDVSGLRELVDGVVVSELAGCSKPDPAIFRAAADACGCRLDGGWMVGDNPEADIGGAAACGLRTVWISRGRRWEETEFVPDIVTDDVPGAVAQILAADGEA